MEDIVAFDFEFFEVEPGHVEDLHNHKEDMDIIDLAIRGLLDKKEKKNHPDMYINSVIEECEDIRKLLDIFPSSSSVENEEEVPISLKHSTSKKKKEKKETIKEISNWVSSLKEKYIIVKGHIQSGKSHFMICFSNVLVAMGFDVVIILRNVKADQIQFETNFHEFQEKHNKKYNKSHILVKSVTKSGNEIIKMPRVILLLGNDINMKKVQSMLKNKYVLFIDEVDAVDSGSEAKKTDTISQLKEGAYCVFGVSGTVMDPIAKEEVEKKNFITLKTPEDYKGIFNGKINLRSKIGDLVIEDKQNKFSAFKNSDLFEKTCLNEFLTEYSKKNVEIDVFGNSHPNICLVNITKCVDPMEKVQTKVGELFPEMVAIVYNGNGLTCKRGLNTLSFSKKSVSIADALQQLKEVEDKRKKINHILIFSGELAGRGISFKSVDRKWYLTDEFLLVAKDTDEPELIQKIRLCGRYQDDIPLTLFSTKKILSDLRKACFRQEEICMEIREEENDAKKIKEISEEIKISHFKMTSRSIFKDEKVKIDFEIVKEEVGLSNSVYSGKELLPSDYYEMYGLYEPSEQQRKKFEKEYEGFVVLGKGEELDETEYIRLVKMFKKWEHSGTKIANFMRNLDPQKEYTQREFRELCDENHIIPTHVCVYNYSKSKGHGKIIQKIADTYRLYPCLVKDFKIFF